MIKNIIFDVGKVLIGWDPYITMRETLHFDEETIKAISGSLFDSGAWGEEDRGVLTGEELLGYFISLCPGYEKEIRLYYEHATDSVVPMSYSRDWITTLKNSGKNVYILSNFGEAAFYKSVEMGGINFLDLVDGYIFSYSVRTIKPEPEIYHILMDRYKLIPDECVFIDDSLRNVEGAEAVGIHGIHFTGYEDAVKKLKEMGV